MIHRLSSFALFVLLSKTQAQWRPDLPWTDLSSAIAGELIDTTPLNFLEECAPEFEKLPGVFGDPTSTWDRSNHGLVDQPSGLCLPMFFCSFEDCAPTNPDDEGPISALDKLIYGVLSVPNETPYSQMNSTILSWVEDTSNPSYNLPSKVLFPVQAADVVAAVKFAKEHGLELSVKNSGHSFTGASSKKDTLLLNMARYKEHAATDGVLDCSTLNYAGVGEDPSLDMQPCRLSLAKGKNAVIRVGGGENWGEVFAAVRKANEEQLDGYKYHAVGGAAATVSPMGWTFSGGLAGTVGGRLYGFGVDQVLQLEMVIPSGHHVKFGPTEWELVVGHNLPKTLMVSGVCNNAAPTEPEEWGVCPDDLAVSFEDLWLAVRGGGGGTWGVVLSVYLQLHDYLPLELLSFKPWACANTEVLTEEQKAIASGLVTTFQTKSLLDPTSVGMTKAESNACGAPDGTGGRSLYCFGDGSATVIDNAWKAYLTESRSYLEGLGFPADIIDTTLSCSIAYEEGTNIFQDIVYQATPNTTVVSYKDYLQFLTYPDGFSYAGLGLDSPLPGYSALGQVGMILVPATWALENLETAVAGAPIDSAYKAFGGEAFIGDQMDSLSTAHRSAGYMYGAMYEAEYNDIFFSTVFPQMFDTSDKSNFPAFLGGNHAGMLTRGPLKSDWTKACPLSWSQEERDEKCISLQECIWGTELLTKLEAIKEAIDPDYIFDCNGCVGNNRKSGTINATSAPVTASPVSSAPIASEPITESPISSAPIASEPVSSSPVTAAPISTGPTSSPIPGSSASIRSASTYGTYQSIVYLICFVSALVIYG